MKQYMFQRKEHVKDLEKVNKLIVDTVENTTGAKIRS